MTVDCYNSLYVDFGDLAPGDTFWNNDTLYLKILGDAWNTVDIATGFVSALDNDCRVIRAYTKVVSA